MVPSNNVTCTSGRFAAGILELRGAVGDAETWGGGLWGQWYAQPGKIYVWRAPYSGAEFDGPEDGMLLARAVARASKLKLDIRGVVLGTYTSDGQPGVDVVMTADSVIPYAVQQSAGSLGRAALADPSLYRRFPDLAFGSAAHGAPKFVQLTGPPDAIDFWLQHPVIWDDTSGPMEAFVKLRGVYRGEADDGPRLNEWRRDAPPLGPGDKPSSQLVDPKMLRAGMWIAAGAAVAWIGARLYEERAA